MNWLDNIKNDVSVEAYIFDHGTHYECRKTRIEIDLMLTKDINEW